jgi:hypothetical protein
MKAANQPDIARHPRTEELLSYADGELPEIFVPALEQHLAACAECRDLIEDYREPATVAAAEAWPSAADKEAAWRRLQASMAPPAAATAPAPVVAANANALPQAEPAKVVAFPTLVPRPASPIWVWAVPWAATLLLGILFVNEYRRANDLAIRPRVVGSASVSAEDNRNGGRKSVQLKTDGLTLHVLISVEPDSFPVSVELGGPTGQDTLTEDDPSKRFVAVFLPADFPPGIYRVRILDCEQVEREAFDVEILAPER